MAEHTYMTIIIGLGSMINMGHWGQAVLADTHPDVQSAKETKGKVDLAKPHNLPYLAKVSSTRDLQDGAKTSDCLVVAHPPNRLARFTLISH